MRASPAEPNLKQHTVALTWWPFHGDVCGALRKQPISFPPFKHLLGLSAIIYMMGLAFQPHARFLCALAKFKVTLSLCPGHCLLPLLPWGFLEQGTCHEGEETLLPFLANACSSHPQCHLPCLPRVLSQLLSEQIPSPWPRFVLVWLWSLALKSRENLVFPSPSTGQLSLPHCRV